MNGLLVIDKPGGMTSRDVVNRVQQWFPRRTKIGHTGTLDPLATGVLVVCIGAATRLADYVQAMAKTYHAVILLGATSTTDDIEGDITPRPEITPPSRLDIDALIPGFLGQIEQVPPAFSALKIAGRRAHELARQGIEVALTVRTVRIDAIRVQNYQWPRLEVEIDCGKGTYIRSFARDLGDRLGCGGLIEALRRTRIGPFTCESALLMDVDAAKAQAAILPMSTAVADCPCVQLEAHDVIRYCNGQSIRVECELKFPSSDNTVQVINPQGEMIAIGRYDRGILSPHLVFRVEPPHRR